MMQVQEEDAKESFTQYVKMHLFENDEGIGQKKGAKGGKNEGVS